MREGRVKSSAERAEIVKRVLGSELFQKSPKLRELLAYVADHSLKGERELLSEQQIGIAVFGRPPGYNPGDDSIVRVQARNLRERLAEYFESEGAGESIVVSIPKGAYDLSFLPRAMPAVAATSGGGRPKRLVHPAILAAGAFALGLAARGFLTVPAVRSDPPSSVVREQPRPSNLILQAVFAPPTQTLVVFEDPLAGMASLIRGRPFTLAEYATPHGLPDLGATGPDPARDRLQQMLPNSRFLQQANVTFQARLLRAYPQLSQAAVFKHAREIQLSELKSANAILFGAQLTNPWMELYEPRLHFRFFGSDRGRGFENLHPEPGEPREFADRSAEGVTYARIALLSGFQPDTRVLILTGLGSPATEAAAEFVLDSRLLERLPPELGKQLQKLPPHLEMILATSELGRTASEIHVVAWRVGEDERTSPATP